MQMWWESLSKRPAVQAQFEDVQQKLSKKMTFRSFEGRVNRKREPGRKGEVRQDKEKPIEEEFSW